ncbi:hypothetical protein [Neorhizobium tomejilense]|uniref:hypothetical protein n=1 Tax=Neorhizobium tomejilense TaxID=2093828 RepID=UPI000CF9A75C|nr:hypothetical protein [Neorhizobium tomejilense]
MPYCDYCGQAIVIRRIGGRAIPIHLNGSCSGVSTSSKPGYRSNSSDSCCRLTKCPRCGDSVLFIRHNGGSVYIEPPPGPPWPRHEKCFPRESGAGPNIVYDSYLKGGSASGKTIAVVTRAEVHLRGTDTILHLQYEDGSQTSVRVAGVAELQGELVIWDYERNEVRFWKSRDQVYQII